MREGLRNGEMSAGGLLAPELGVKHCLGVLGPESPGEDGAVGGDVGALLGGVSKSRLGCGDDGSTSMVKSAGIGISTVYIKSGLASWRGKLALTGSSISSSLKE